MAVAPEPYLAACLWVLYRAIITCRAGNWSTDFPNEHTADLMDAIHNIPSLIQNWETCDVELLRACLQGYESKWLPKGGIALCQIFDEVVAEGEPGQRAPDSPPSRKMTFGDRPDIFITENTPTVGSFEVQIQFSTFMVTLIAGDLSFARQILDFVAGTKGNPEYRDLHLGGGQYRRIPEKSVDLSASFRESTFVLEKDGEFDDSYVVRLACRPELALSFDLRSTQLDTFIESLRDAL